MPRRVYVLLLAALAFGGCAAGPDYRRPDAVVPQAWQTDPGSWKTDPGWQASRPRDGELKGDWWEIFADAKLNELEQRALQSGQTMAVALTRVEQARAQAAAAGSAFYPNVGLQAGAARERAVSVLPPNAGAPVVRNDFSAGLTVNYELDLFGRVRRQAEAANANAQQAEADFENTRLVFTAELASDYFSLRETDAEIELLRQTLDAQNKALDYIRARHDLGAASGLDLNQQQGLTAATETQLTLLREQRASFQNAIATLVGTPAPDFQLEADARLPRIPEIPAVSPSALLERRPDVAAAERAMAAANAEIGLASSAYFPALGLSGSYGGESGEIANLFSAPSLLWSVGVSATQTLFDGGNISANVDFAKAGYRQAVANYRQSVLTAFQEVQDGLDGDVTLARAAGSAKVAADSAERSLALSTDRYRSGVADNLEVVVAEQTFLGYRRQEVQLHGQRLLNTVHLVKALGGGWHAM